MLPFALSRTILHGLKTFIILRFPLELHRIRLSKMRQLNVFVN